MLKTIHLRTREQSAFYNITSYVRQAVNESGVSEGIAVVFCPHTTAGITIKLTKRSCFMYTKMPIPMSLRI